jgi:hypothetical protein
MMVSTYTKSSKTKFFNLQATDPLEDSFVPSMKSQNGIWMVHWWVLPHSSPFGHTQGEMKKNLQKRYTSIQVHVSPFDSS